MAYLLLKRRAASRTGICRPEENFKGVRIMENKKLLNEPELTTSLIIIKNKLND